MYIVIELQTNNGTTAVAPVKTYDNLNVAYQSYYTVLSAAAVSSVPIHTAIIMNERGAVLKSETFLHEGEVEK